MDGHFVPPITMGPLVVEAIADQVHAAGALIDVHLMIERPERHVDAFAEGGRGLDHASTSRRRRTCTTRCRRSARPGCRAGLALNPGTPAEAVSEVVDDVDLVLCMTVNPGWGGQAFLATLARQARAPARAARRPGRRSRSTAGSTPTPPAPCAAAGRDAVRRRARAVFGAPDPAAAVREIAAAIGA